MIIQGNDVSYLGLLQHVVLVL